SSSHVLQRCQLMKMQKRHQT
ncbi:abgT transporter family protein, partial [Vibrio parahaemolyticus V-223/04]